MACTNNTIHVFNVNLFMRLPTTAEALLAQLRTRELASHSTSLVSGQLRILTPLARALARRTLRCRCRRRRSRRMWADVLRKKVKRLEKSGR